MPKPNNASTAFFRTDFIDEWPCTQHCPSRHCDCHATCKAYLAYEKKHLARKKREAKERAYW